MNEQEEKQSDIKKQTGRSRNVMSRLRLFTVENLKEQSQMSPLFIPTEAEESGLDCKPFAVTSRMSRSR
jgi:hypothetical protein